LTWRSTLPGRHCSSAAAGLAPRWPRSPDGTPNFGNLTFKAGKAVFSYGQFVTAALAFLISALVVYFILVLPVSRLLQLLERNKAATTRDCPECTMSIPVAARRCPQCTAEITAATERPQPVG